jgi:hypothetical protein
MKTATKLFIVATATLLATNPANAIKSKLLASAS